MLLKELDAVVEPDVDSVELRELDADVLAVVLSVELNDVEIEVEADVDPSESCRRRCSP